MMCPISAMPTPRLPPMFWPATSGCPAAGSFFSPALTSTASRSRRRPGRQDEEPLQLADRVMQRFKNLWVTLNIANTDFIRTSEARHQEAVQKFFRTLEEKGDIYLGEYEDWYCVPCESFWTDTQLVDGKCPNQDCRRPVEKLREESYFFRMSKYQQQLLQYLEENPGFIQPESRYNEIVSFVREGLRDLSISRTSFSWGIPVPGNPRHVIYVWFDALLNYISALDYCAGGESFQAFWPAQVHIVGKDIVRFHGVYWPAMLMAAGLPAAEADICPRLLDH